MMGDAGMMGTDASSDSPLIIPQILGLDKPRQSAMLPGLVSWQNGYAPACKAGLWEFESPAHLQFHLSPKGYTGTAQSGAGPRGVMSAAILYRAADCHMGALLTRRVVSADPLLTRQDRRLAPGVDGLVEYYFLRKDSTRGCSSVVEHLLAKQKAEGSSPSTRSSFLSDPNTSGLEPVSCTKSGADKAFGTIRGFGV